MITDQLHQTIPENGAEVAVVAAFILGVPSLYQVGGASVAFFAIVSIGTVGLYVAYAIPIFLRLRAGKNFQTGPWNLGEWSTPIGTIAVVWVGIITILFFAPAFYPWTTAIDINWSGPVFVLVMAIVFTCAACRRASGSPDQKSKVLNRSSMKLKKSTPRASCRNAELPVMAPFTTTHSNSQWELEWVVVTPDGSAGTHQ